jgi:hypothetical protein
MERCSCGRTFHGAYQKQMKVCSYCLATMLKAFKRELRIEHFMIRGTDEIGQEDQGEIKETSTEH